MADMTNITDFDPATGRTTTTLVATHNRSPKEEATRDGQSHDTWHRDDTPPATGDPQINKVSPQQLLIATPGLSTLTIDGLNFVAGSIVEVDGLTCPTTFVSATRLTATYDQSAVGTVFVSVRNPNNEESNSVGIKVI